MGLILDTSILIARERQRGSVDEVLQHAQTIYGEIDIGISAVSVVELTNGMYRAKSEQTATVAASS